MKASAHWFLCNQGLSITLEIEVYASSEFTSSDILPNVKVTLRDLRLTRAKFCSYCVSEEHLKGDSGFVFAKKKLTLLLHGLQKKWFNRENLRTLLQQSGTYPFLDINFPAMWLDQTKSKQNKFGREKLGPAMRRLENFAKRPYWNTQKTYNIEHMYNIDHMCKYICVTTSLQTSPLCSRTP